MWVEICQEQSKIGGSFVMMMTKGELEDHESIRPRIPEAGSWVIKFTVGQSEWRMITNIKNIKDHMKKSGSILEMRHDNSMHHDGRKSKRDNESGRHWRCP